MKITFRPAAAALALSLIALQPAVALAQAEPMSSAITPLGELLDNAKSKAVLQKHVPQLVASEKIQQARSQTLKQLANYAGDALPPSKLAEIDADLAKLTEAK